MRVTFILKNLTDDAYATLDALSDEDRFAKLTKWAFGDLKHCVSQKIGPSNSFRDRCDLNDIMKRNTPRFEIYKLEPRKGYKLATFEILKG